MSSFGGTVKLTGESEYKKALASISSSLKVLNSEMKMVTSQYDKNDTSVENLSSQNEILNKKIDEQKNKVAVLTQALESAKAETGENSDTSKKWQADLNNAQAELNKLNRELSNNSEKLADATEKENGFATQSKYAINNIKDLTVEMLKGVTGTSNFGKTIKSDLTERVNDAKDKIKNTGESIKNFGSSVADTIKHPTKLGESIKGKLVEAVEKLEKSTDKSTDAVEDFGEEAEKSSEKMLSLGDVIKANLISEAIMSGLSALGNAIKGVGAKFSEFLALGEETKEMNTAMAKLQASFDSAFGETEVSAEMATDSIYALYGVLGDTDKAVEASNLLAKMSKDEADLDANTRILTGVFAEFGESIPTEGLAEGMQATAEMGNVQGVLADALEWQGINLDEYNEKLATMTTAEERASYIQSTLTNLYGASADAYRENNQALIESNEAQLRYEQHLADMGKLTLPLNTDIKNMSTYLMQGFMPALESVMPDVQALSGSFTDLIKAVTRGDGGGIQDAMSMISQNVELLIENLKSTLPQVTEVVIDLISTLITVITDNLPYIVEEGMKLLNSLLFGIMQMLPQIMPTVMLILQTLTATILGNLPMLIDTGIQILASLVQGIVATLPELIPTMIDAVLLMVETLLDNIDLLIDVALDLIIALADGLIKALPKLIDKIPVIIEKMILAITNNIPQIIETGITLVVKLALGLIKAIPQLIGKIPEIMKSLIDGFKNYFSNMGEVGKNLVEGLWNGIKDATGWVLEKIKGFGKSILNGIKEIFGIHSPSTLFRDEVGKNLALGIGEGFSETMSDVSADMQSAIPTEFDTNIDTTLNVASGQSQFSTFNMMVLAFKQALSEVKIIMDDREMGGFITNTVEKVVFN